MDPNACLEAYFTAIAQRDRDEADHCWLDLYEWLQSGGFEPNWEGVSRRWFEGRPHTRGNDI